MKYLSLFFSSLLILGGCSNSVPDESEVMAALKEWYPKNTVQCIGIYDHGYNYTYTGDESAEMTAHLEPDELAQVKYLLEKGWIEKTTESGPFDEMNVSFSLKDSAEFVDGNSLCFGYKMPVKIVSFQELPKMSKNEKTTYLTKVQFGLGELYDWAANKRVQQIFPGLAEEIAELREGGVEDFFVYRSEEGLKLVSKKGLIGI